MDNKAISPLIAVVMLIAFTVAIAALLTTWVKTFTQERTAQIDERAGKEIECTWAGLYFPTEPYYNKSSNTSLTIYTTVENRGTATLKDFKLIVISKDKRSRSYSTGYNIEDITLNPGDVATFKVIETNATIDFENDNVLNGGKIRVVSSTCPSVYYEKSI